MIYGSERAAARLGIHKRYFLELARRIGKKASPMGTRRRLLFSEAEVDEIGAMLTKKSLKSKHSLA